MKKTFKVLPPMMSNYVRFETPPMSNYVRFETPPGLRQDMFKKDQWYDIANFTEQEAQDFAELMRITFMQHWRERKSKVVR